MTSTDNNTIEGVPHGPDEPCTCDGCRHCWGHQDGCTCDIDWEKVFRRD